MPKSGENGADNKANGYGDRSDLSVTVVVSDIDGQGQHDQRVAIVSTSVVLITEAVSVTVPVSVLIATIQIRFASVPPISVAIAAIGAAAAVLAGFLHSFLMAFLTLGLFLS